MKKYNFKPLYIFLILVSFGFIMKMTMQKKSIKGRSYHFEQSKDTPYKNSFEKDMHEYADSVKKGKQDLLDEAAEKGMDVIIPGE